MQKTALLYHILCMNQKGSKQESKRIEYYKINKKQTSYLSVYNLSIIFVTKWHSICITRDIRQLCHRADCTSATEKRKQTKKDYEYEF